MKVRQLVSTVVQPKPIDVQNGRGSRTQNTTPGAFAQELLNADKLQSLRPVELSHHAQQRIEERGIDMSAERMDQIAQAVSALNDKGATNALLLGAGDAFVVSVPNRIVVTAMQASEMTERAFTNIDSAYILNETK